MIRYLKVLAVLALSLLITTPSFAKRGSNKSGANVYVHGYVKKDGTYVAPHMRSAPDGDKSNNWSTEGNYNPYTGKEGTKKVEPNYPPKPEEPSTPTEPAPGDSEKPNDSPTNPQRVAS